VFTGIIKEVGSVAAIDTQGGARRLSISASMAPDLRIDESVSVSGVCQTVVAAGPDYFSVVAIEETLSKTNLGQLSVGVPVNLERALMLPARLDGHLVQGHVDTTGEVEAVESLSSSHLFRIAYPTEWAQYLIPTGSITVDGISLTVARLTDRDFTVAIIPYTLEHTAIRHTWQPGSRVNLEFDLVGKYVIRRLEVTEARQK